MATQSSTVSKMDELNAIAWAARQANMSYGTFVVSLTKETKKQCVQKYLEMKRKEKEDEAERLKKYAQERKSSNGLAELENKRRFVISIK